MRSDRWSPNPETSQATACDFTAGAAVACYPAKPPAWLDLTLDTPAWTCAQPPAPTCPPVAIEAPCAGSRFLATEGQVYVRFEGTDLVVNGVSLFDPWDWADLLMQEPLRGRDECEVFP